MKKLMFFTIFLLGLDFFTKWLCSKFLPPMIAIDYPFGGIPLFNAGGVSASLNQVRNSGAAWGAFQGFPGILAILRFAAGGFLLFSKRLNFATMLIAVGALGNGIDYFIYGQVIDFVYFNFWGYPFPVFNLADCCITVGAFLMLFSPRHKTAPTS